MRLEGNMVIHSGTLESLLFELSAKHARCFVVFLFSEILI